MCHSYQSHAPFVTPVLMTGTLDGGSAVVQAAAYVVAPPVVPPGSTVP